MLEERPRVRRSSGEERLTGLRFVEKHTGSVAALPKVAIRPTVGGTEAGHPELGAVYLRGRLEKRE